MKALLPLRTKPSPSRIAMVFIPAASEPHPAPRPPVLGGGARRETAVPAELPDNLPGKRPARVVVGDHRGDLLLGELPDRLPDHHLVVGKLEVHHRSVRAR